MTCEALSKGESIFHRADPRIKILFAIFLSLEIVWLKGVLALFIAWILSLALLVSARFEKKIIIRRLALINFFIVLMWLVLPWTTPGSSLLVLGPFNITREGIFSSLIITLKCNSIMMFNITLLSTSTIFSIAHALDHLKVPSTLVQLIFFTWRYLHVLEEEYIKLKQAAELRGFRPRPNLFTYRTYGYLLGTLFVRSYDRGQRVYYALLCRGFNGTFWLLTHFRLKKVDIILASLLSSVVLTLAYFNGGGFGFN